MARNLQTEPRAENRTVRQAISDYLKDGPLTARELSALVHIQEKEVIPHLEHLEKSLRRARQRLVIEPARCLECGFRFEKRRRLSRPGACPRCRCQRIDPPAFRLATPGKPGS